MTLVGRSEAIDEAKCGDTCGFEFEFHARTNVRQYRNTHRDVRILSKVGDRLLYSVDFDDKVGRGEILYEMPLHVGNSCYFLHEVNLDALFRSRLRKRKFREDRCSEDRHDCKLPTDDHAASPSVIRGGAGSSIYKNRTIPKPSGLMDNIAAKPVKTRQSRRSIELLPASAA
jgi:hypothetical protein